MKHFQDTGAITQHIQHVEQNVTSDAMVWSQKARPSTLAECMEYYKVPGMSIAVINNGEIEWARGYGALEAGKPELVTPETIFQVCSISKHVAMIGTLRLVQEGILALDEDVNHYLTSWKIPANDSWQPRITLCQLLAHTAGLVYNWYRGFHHRAPVPTLLQVLEGQSPANTPPVRAVLIPGSQFRYSGSHYSVLQQLLIDVTGKPFPALMQELVFNPLEMHNSSYDQSYPDTRPESTAVGHHLGGEPVAGKWRVFSEMAAAGLWTTASDLARLICEVQQAVTGKPTKLLGKSVVEQALTPQVTKDWGLGVHLEGYGQTRRFGHGGDNIGYKCLSVAYAEGGMGAVILTNADDGESVIVDVLSAIAREYKWPDYLPNHDAVMINSQIYDTYVGEYEIYPGFSFSVTRTEQGLSLKATDQMPLTLQPSSEVAFSAQALNSEITFTKNAEGEVVGLILKQDQQEISGKKIGLSLSA